MHFLWKNKIKLFTLVLVIFIFSVVKLFSTKIFFDTERIINDISKEVEFTKLLNDENLIFVGFDFNNSLSYDGFIKIKELHQYLSKKKDIKRVESIINERKSISKAFLPIPIKVLNLDNINQYEKSLAELEKYKSNFINNDRSKIFFLIEVQELLKRESAKELVDELFEIKIGDLNHENFVSGRIPSEIYMQKNVINEFIILTTLSAILCFILLFLLTTNIKLILMIILSVIFSIIITLSLSSFLYGGIEMIMIITPAILFIVCISDAMHYTTNQTKNIKDKFLFFKDRLSKIGVAIFLTSLTTSISFLTFLINDIIPVARFGLITSFGILITLIVVTIVYAIAIDFEFHLTKQSKYFKALTDLIIQFSLKRKSKFFHAIMITFILCSLYNLFNINIDNYLTDEVNSKSQMHKQVSFFDKNFGGIKSIYFKVNNISNDSFSIQNFQSTLSLNGFTVDFSNAKLSNKFLTNTLPVFKNLDSDYLFLCRMPDLGSKKTKNIIESILGDFEPLLKIQVGGVGYLFDNISESLTKQLIFGLAIAICSIGLIFFVLTKFNPRFIFIAIIPNIVPIILTLFVLQFFNFYLSLSNAFIFTIVFGLIVDDSIHIISAYIRNKAIKNSKTINDIIRTTGRAIVKTTLVVIFCLFPLIFSEFKSVSQLAVITIIAAVIAVFFDLIYLPVLMKLNKKI